MAHGEFIMIGAYTTFLVQNFFLKFIPKSAFDFYFPLALIFSFAVAFGFGLLLERLVIRRLYGRETDSLLATWGVSLVLQQLARTIFGAPNVNISAPSFLNGNITLFASQDSAGSPLKNLILFFSKGKNQIEKFPLSDFFSRLQSTLGDISFYFFLFSFIRVVIRFKFVTNITQAPCIFVS